MALELVAGSASARESWEFFLDSAVKFKRFQIFGCEFGKWFLFLPQKKSLVYKCMLVLIWKPCSKQQLSMVSFLERGGHEWGFLESVKFKRFQIFGCEFGKWFLFLSQKKSLFCKYMFAWIWKPCIQQQLSMESFLERGGHERGSWNCNGVGGGISSSTWIMGISRDPPVNVAWPISLWDLCHSLPACAWRDHFFFDSYGISSHMSQAFLPAQTNPHSTRSIDPIALAPRCGFEQKVKLFF